MPASDGLPVQIMMPFVGPALNLGSTINQLQAGQFWKLAGVDGRYMGSLRRFPGFRPISWQSDIRAGASGEGRLDGSSTPTYAEAAGWLDSPILGTTYFFKYAAIQKGDSDYMLRGFVFHSKLDLLGTPTVYILFLHYDEEDDNWYFYRVDSQTGNTWEETDQIDCCVTGKVLHISVKGKENLSIRWNNWDKEQDTSFTIGDGAGGSGGTTDELYVEKVDGVWTLHADTPDDDPTTVTLGGYDFTITGRTGNTDYPVKAFRQNTDADEGILFVDSTDYLGKILVPDDDNTGYLSLGQWDTSNGNWTDESDPLPVKSWKDVGNDEYLICDFTNMGTGFAADSEQHKIVVDTVPHFETFTMGPGDEPPFPESVTVGNSYGRLSAGDVQIRYRWYDERRNLFSPLSQIITKTVIADDLVGLVFDDSDIAAQQEKGFNYLFVYRTIADDNVFYLEQIVEFPTDKGYPGTNRRQPNDVMAGTDYNRGTSNKYVIAVGGSSQIHNPNQLPDSDAFPAVTYPSWPVEKKFWSLGLDDVGLVRQTYLDPVLDSTGPPPLSGLMSSYQDMVLMQDEAESKVGGSTSTVRWSSLISDSPENFPLVDHYYKPPQYGHKLLALVEGGDYAYAIRTDGVVRFHRSGTVMEVNEFYRKVGGRSRYSSTTIGNSLWMATSFGLVLVDGTSGRQDVTGAMGRLFSDPTYYWRADLDNIHMCFDGELGALMILNTTTSEIYLLWLESGVVTSLIDVPFTRCTEGAHPTTGGQPVGFFLVGAGDIFIADHDRTSNSLTLPGLSSNTTVVASGTPTTTSVPINTYVVSGSAYGFRAYVLTGAARGQSATITGVSGSVLTLSASNGLTTAPAAGDVLSIAPVVMDVRPWGMRGSNTPDITSRKYLTSCMAHVDILSGDDGVMEGVYQVRTEEGDSSPTEAYFSLDEDPADTSQYLNVGGKQIYPGIKIFNSDVDLALQGLHLTGTISGSLENTQVSGH